MSTLRSLASIPRRFPLAFAIGYGGVKTVGADIMVQKTVEKRAELDTKRATVFLCFGLFQVGFVQYMLYVTAYTRVFSTAAQFAALPFRQKLRDRQGLINLAKQVLFDQFVYHPCCYFPVFYTCKEIILGEAQGPRDTVTRAIQKYIPNMRDDLCALWKIFIPVSIIQFSIMPMHFRVPFTATAGIVWCAILSMMRGAPQLSEAAKDVRRTLGDLSPEELTARLDRLFEAQAKTGTMGMDREQFQQFMHRLGMRANSQTMESFFDAFDTDTSGLIDANEFVKGLQVLCGKGSPKERIRFVFEAMDLNNDKAVTQQECQQVIQQLLHMREVLLEFPVDFDNNSKLFLGVGSRRAPRQTAAEEEKRRLRLRYIWGQHPDYYGQPLQECLRLQAVATTARMFDEVCGMDGDVSVDRFERWIEARSSHSIRLMSLFNVLAAPDREE